MTICGLSLHHGNTESSRFLRLSVFPWCKDSPQIVMLWWEWLGRLKWRATGLDASVLFCSQKQVGKLRFDSSLRNSRSLTCHSHRGRERISDFRLLNADLRVLIWVSSYGKTFLTENWKWRDSPRHLTIIVYSLFLRKYGSILWMKSLISHRGCLHLSVYSFLFWEKVIWMTSWPLFIQNRFHFDMGPGTRCASICSVLWNCFKTGRWLFLIFCIHSSY